MRPIATWKTWKIKILDYFIEKKFIKKCIDRILLTQNMQNKSKINQNISK